MIWFSVEWLPNEWVRYRMENIIIHICIKRDFRHSYHVSWTLDASHRGNGSKYKEKEISISFVGMNGWYSVLLCRNNDVFVQFYINLLSAWHNIHGNLRRFHLCKVVTRCCVGWTKTREIIFLRKKQKSNWRRISAKCDYIRSWIDCIGVIGATCVVAWQNGILNIPSDWFLIAFVRRSANTLTIHFLRCHRQMKHTHRQEYKSDNEHQWYESKIQSESLNF